MTSRASAKGLTIVEVIIAIAILAIGVLAALGFQVATLRTNTESVILNQITRVATTELEVRRQTAPEITVTNCVTDLPDGFPPDGCTVEFRQCTLELDEDNRLREVCPGTPFVTYEIVVTVRGPNGVERSFSSITPVQYVSGGVMGGLIRTWRDGPLGVD